VGTGRKTESEARTGQKSIVEEDRNAKRDPNYDVFTQTANIAQAAIHMRTVLWLVLEIFIDTYNGIVILSVHTIY